MRPWVKSTLEELHDDVDVLVVVVVLHHFQHVRVAQLLRNFDFVEDHFDFPVIKHVQIEDFQYISSFEAFMDYFPNFADVRLSHRGNLDPVVLRDVSLRHGHVLQQVRQAHVFHSFQGVPRLLFLAGRVSHLIITI